MLNEPTRHDPESGSGDDVELREEIEEVERRASRRVEFGRRGFGLALLVFILSITLVLPWTNEHAGWQALVGEAGVVPRMFASVVVVIGIIAAALTLITRRWWLAWVCAVGGWLMSVEGLLAVWSQQSTGAPGVAGEGPGIGMVIALLTAIVFAINWMRVAGSRR